MFNKSLVARNLWRWTYNDALWGRVLKSKYLGESSMEELFRLDKKVCKNYSIV